MLIEIQAMCLEGNVFCLMFRLLLGAMHALYKSIIQSNNHEVITIPDESYAMGSHLAETAISMTNWRKRKIYYLYCF